MAKNKGKIISLAFGLMSAYPEAQAEADALVRKETGKGAAELEPEGWYDTKVFHEMMEIYGRHSLSGRRNAYLTLGRKVYPTIKKTAGIPESVKTPLDFVKYEAEGFLANHQGSDVIPRKFLKLTEGLVEVYAPAPGYDELHFEGVYLGILETCGVKSGKVENLGASVFRITW